MERKLYREIVNFRLKKKHMGLAMKYVFGEIEAKWTSFTKYYNDIIYILLRILRTLRTFTYL